MLVLTVTVKPLGQGVSTLAPTSRMPSVPGSAVICHSAVIKGLIHTRVIGLVRRGSLVVQASRYAAGSQEMVRATGFAPARPS